MNKEMKANLLMLLGGLVAFAVGLFFTISGMQQAARDTEPAVAEVIDYVEDIEHDSSNDGDRYVYYPVVSYEVNGETIESQYSQRDYDQPYAIGENIDIKYNPNDPEEFIIVGDSSLQYGAIWVIPLGAVMAIIGLVRTLKALSRK